MLAASALGPSQKHKPGLALLASAYCSVVFISRLLLAFWPACCQFVRQHYNSEAEMSCQCDVTLALLRETHSHRFYDRLTNMMRLLKYRCSQWQLWCGASALSFQSTDFPHYSNIITVHTICIWWSHRNQQWKYFLYVL